MIKIDLLNKSHILILPTSHEEGLPIAILEAMISGLSIVSRPVGGINDFFQNGKMGYLVDSFEPKEFSDNIQNSINNLESIRKYNMIFGKNNFHPKKLADTLISTFKKDSVC